MTIQSHQSQVVTFIPHQYEIFAGLDVDKHSIAVTFTDHTRLLKSLRLPYSSEQLLNYTRKHFRIVGVGPRATLQTASCCRFESGQASPRRLAAVVFRRRGPS